MVSGSLRLVCPGCAYQCRRQRCDAGGCRPAGPALGCGGRATGGVSDGCLAVGDERGRFRIVPRGGGPGPGARWRTMAGRLRTAIFARPRDGAVQIEWFRLGQSPFALSLAAGFGFYPDRAANGRPDGPAVGGHRGRGCLCLDGGAGLAAFEQLGSIGDCGMQQPGRGQGWRDLGGNHGFFAVSDSQPAGDHAPSAGTGETKSGACRLCPAGRQRLGGDGWPGRLSLSSGHLRRGRI